MQAASSEYSAKLPTTVDKTLYALGWKVDELGRLCECERKAIVDMVDLIEVMSADECDVTAANLPHRICMLKKSLSTLLKGK